jgi:hypothetical protein
MHGQAPTISVQELYAQLGTAAAPVVVDVRKSAGEQSKKET